MAAIHDLIAQIGEERLRERLAAEWARATRERKFGLVFEEHLPELLPLPKARPRKGDLVAPRGGSLKDLWRVRGAKGGRLQCTRPQAEADAAPEASTEFEPAEVMVVRAFGEPIFPALVPVDAVANGDANAPWHTLIEADNYHALQLLGYATWQVGPQTLERILGLGYVKLGGYDVRRATWTIMFLGSEAERQLAQGELVVVGGNDELGCVEVAYAVAEQRSLKTVWHRPLHDSGVYGSLLLKTILGDGGKFKYPKALYSTKDAIAAVLRNQPDALVVDFFAGSGTTLNAVNLLNAVDGGSRRCILVTNNEVSASEADTLRERSLQPGDDEWEAQGICRSVTWPRSKFTIRPQRDDGTFLPGEYLTGRRVQRAKPRRSVQIGFVEPAQIDTPAKKKQMLALIDGLPQTLVRNMPHKPWSPEIPYETAAEVRPMFPDSVVVRKVGEQLRVDMLEPHDPSRDDNVDKARGLARFAGRHGALFGRIQLIRKRKVAGGGEQFVRLEINRQDTMQKLLILSQASQLDALFDGAH